MNELIAKIKKANYIFICGNGGSAATAEHFATDLVKKGYRAIALSSNSSVITMLANDYGYEHAFDLQVAVFATYKDLLITISCSGNSKNIVNAQETASMLDLMQYSFETFKDGDENFGKLEDKHLKFAHKIASKLPKQIDL